MARRIATLALVTLLATPAGATWKVHSYTDRVSDKVQRFASVEAEKPDQGVAATIFIHCLNDSTVGGRIVQLKTTALFTRGNIGLRYRIDGREAEDRYMPVSSDGRGVSLWADANDLLGGKSIKLELQPARGPNLFFVFDLGGSAAVRALPCKKQRD